MIFVSVHDRSAGFIKEVRILKQRVFADEEQAFRFISSMFKKDYVFLVRFADPIDVKLYGGDQFEVCEDYDQRLSLFDL